MRAIRPHHALCIRFFEGKGYSRDFTDNMYRVISFLQRGNPSLTLAKVGDPICAFCPNLNGEVCDDCEKTDSFDKAVLKVLSLDFGDEITWSDLYEKANEEIIKSGRLCEICSSCCWFSICNR